MFMSVKPIPIKQVTRSNRGSIKPPFGPTTTAVAAAGEPPFLLTAEDVARYLQISIRSVFRLKSLGLLPRPVAVLGSVRWRRADIEEWVAAGCPRLNNGRWDSPNQQAS